MALAGDEQRFEDGGALVVAGMAGGGGQFFLAMEEGRVEFSARLLPSRVQARY